MYSEPRTDFPKVLQQKENHFDAFDYRTPTTAKLRPNTSVAFSKTSSGQMFYVQGSLSAREQTAN